MTQTQDQAVLPGQRTAPGRVSAQPAGLYEPPQRIVVIDGAPRVLFAGVDGRDGVFDFADLPLPGLHADLAAALARRTVGHSGKPSTFSTATNIWSMTRRFVRFLGALPRPPRDLSRLSANHLRRYRLEVSRGMNTASLATHILELRNLLEEVTPLDRLAPEVLAWLAEPSCAGRRTPGVPGYDDETREKILKAARSDTVAILRRFEASERLLERLAKDPDSLSGAQRTEAQMLAEMARTGVVPLPPREAGPTWPLANLPGATVRKQTARRLFLTHEDLVPLVVLGVMLTGRNGETIKELPAEHRLLESKAVELEVVKRRHGAERWYEPATWEIGRDSARLHTPGGYYLLMHRLCALGRRFSGSPLVWSVLVNHPQDDPHAGHRNPFAKTLMLRTYPSEWVAGCPELAAIPDFELTMNRLKSTEDRRYTRATGGHLPSSTRSNTQDVLFNSYLRGDPVVIDWAEGVLAEAIADAEQTARAEHQRLLAEHDGQVRVLPGSAETARNDPQAAARQLGINEATARDVLAGRNDTAFLACENHEDNPHNDGPCRKSFIVCFMCRNALSTEDHLPAQLALLDELAELWESTDRHRWWAAYGQAWLAINEDILPRFSAEERAAAEARKPAEKVLHLLEGPWEEA